MKIRYLVILSIVIAALILYIAATRMTPEMGGHIVLATASFFIGAVTAGVLAYGLGLNTATLRHRNQTARPRQQTQAQSDWALPMLAGMMAGRNDHSAVSQGHYARPSQAPEVVYQRSPGKVTIIGDEQ